jgi:hypothetical protein
MKKLGGTGAASNEFTIDYVSVSHSTIVTVH